jgi:hypothetical protein
MQTAFAVETQAAHHVDQAGIAMAGVDPFHAAR